MLTIAAFAVLPLVTQQVATARRVDAKLTRAADALIAAGRGDEALDVIVITRGPASDTARLAAARALPRDDDAEVQLRRQELADAADELESDTRARHATVTASMQRLGATDIRPLWLVNAETAHIAAKDVLRLAALPEVARVELDEICTLGQGSSCSISVPPFPFATPKSLNGTAAHNNALVWKYGGELQLQLASARAAGYTGEIVPPTGPVQHVQIGIADSGFDLNTDQWRPAIPCWCPQSTVILSPTCNAFKGVHGEFTRADPDPATGYRFCITSSRVIYQTDLFVGGCDTTVSPEALYWGAPFTWGTIVTGSNWVGYGHGTMVTSLAGGSVYFDWQSTLKPNCKMNCSDLIGAGLCDPIGMQGVAPLSELSLYKIGSDCQSSTTSLSCEINAVQTSASRGDDVLNLSYSTDPDPTSPTAIGFDRAAHDFDLVVCVSAGNNGQSGGPVQVTSGFYNGLIVGSVGRAPLVAGEPDFSDLVAPGASHGYLAWMTSPTTTFVSARDGINIVAPGGYWPEPQQGLDLPYPEGSYTGSSASIWAIGNQVGTSYASPQVTGAAALAIESFAEHATSISLRPTSTAIRAVLLNAADDVSGKNPASYDERYYGQGRVDAFASAEFYAPAGTGKVFESSVTPSAPIQDFVVQISGLKMETTLTWDRVVFDPLVADYHASKLQLEVYDGNPNAGGALVASASHPANNYVRLSTDDPRHLITLPHSGTYYLRVNALSFAYDSTHSTPPVRFAVAFSQKQL